MKRIVDILLNILLCFTCSIIIILSLAFLFIEGRLLISLDWSIYDFAFAGFIRYLFRFLLALFALSVCVFELVNLKKKNKTLSIYLFVADISLVLMSIFALIFTANYVGVICLVLSTLLVLSRLKITIKRD